MRWLLFMAAAALALPGCDNDRETVAAPAPPAPPPPGPAVLPNAVIPPGSTPPIGVTFEVAFTEDVFPADFSIHAAAWTSAASLLWQVTEGQTYIDAVNMTDNVNPGSTSSSLTGAYNAPGLDVVVWSPSDWDVGGAQAFVVYAASKGRDGRAMALQTTADQDVILHEVFHFLYVLSWRYYQMPDTVATLDDEYLFQPDDAECVMEVTGVTPRLCSGGPLASANHLVSPNSTPPNSAQAVLVGITYQDGQPRSCWEQILLDYPAFTYMGANSTAAPTPTTQINITNTGVN